MAYKKIAGYWRDDKQLEESMMIDRCTECGHHLEWIMWPDSPYGDYRLHKMWGDYEAWDNDKDWESAFDCDHVVTECDNCGEEFDLGEWYWNDATENYDLSRPVGPRFAKRLEAEAERQAQIDAGQLVMF